MMEPQVEGALQQALQLLGDHKHLNRTKAIDLLNSLFTGDGLPERDVSLVVAAAEALLRGQQWEQRLGGLMAGKAVIDHLQLREFDHGMVLECMRLLEDEEVRVRIAVGDCLHSLASKHGVVVYEQLQERVLASINDNYDREGEGSKAGPQQQGPAAAQRPSPGRNDLLSTLLQQTYRVEQPGSGEMRHGTEGWRCLETSVRSLQQLVDGCGPLFRQHVTPELRQLLFRTFHHPNRFVREHGHNLMASLCRVLAGEELADVAEQMAPRLADGLSDSWSQVRYRACVAVRTLLTTVPEHKDRLLPWLIGPMCLNRYYVADGVRMYANESWRLVMGAEGRGRCAQFVDQLASYYITQTKASSHAVREAACASIAELMEKVDPSAVRPHVEALLRALLVCFRDLGWTVREAACSALGRCVLAYPEQASCVKPELLPLWFEHLHDNIPSVRESSAAALACAARAYGAAAADEILQVAQQLLPRAHEQPAETRKYGQTDSTDRFSAASRRARDQDSAVHSGQEMFSCGSLASHLSTGYQVRGDGCMDDSFKRERQPWEASDGAVYVLRELSAICPERVAPLLPPLASLSRLASFQHAFSLHATIWRSLPLVARNVGKREFKQHLELFLPGLFDDLVCGHQLAEAAAGECIARLRDWLGAGILAGRLSEEQRRLLHSNANIPPPPAAAGAPYPQRILMYGQPVTASGLLGHLGQMRSPLPTA